MLLKKRAGAPAAAAADADDSSESSLKDEVDTSLPSSYIVQVYASPGIDHHEKVCEAARSGESDALYETLQASAPMLMASSDDLTLEEVDNFLRHVLAAGSGESAGGSGSASGSVHGGGYTPLVERSNSASRAESASQSLRASGSRHGSISVPASPPPKSR